MVKTYPTLVEGIFCGNEYVMTNLDWNKGNLTSDLVANISYVEAQFRSLNLNSPPPVGTSEDYTGTNYLTMTAGGLWVVFRIAQDM